MKKIFLFALAAISMATVSCEGPEGPMGASGNDGLLAEVFEVNANFINNPDEYLAYREFYDLNPAIYTSDNILVYELSEVVNGSDVWKLLPQIYTFNQGIMQYNYDFTAHDFSIFIDANFDRATLPSAFRNNKVFRIVIVPGEFSNRQRQITDYNEVVEKYNIKESDIKTLQPISK